MKRNISVSVAAGRTYRRAAIVRKASRRNSGLKLKTRKGGSLVVVGFQFHRASRRGQPPAIDTGKLINSIRALRISKFRHRINVGALYGAYLDDPEVLDRPFFASRVELFRPVFFENMRRAVLGK